MKKRLLHIGLLLSLLFFNCAFYKQLKPKPLISPVENLTYTELKKGDKNLKLSQGKNYYISFPAPKDDKFTLVLDISENKSKFVSKFTDQLVKETTPGNLLDDLSPNKNRLFAYPVDTKKPVFFWLIEGVTQDMELKVSYRYVPRWRFEFENKYAQFQKTLKENVKPRDNYEKLGVGFNPANGVFNITTKINEIDKSFGELDTVYKQLLEIKSLFPSNIQTNDKAYRNYGKLKVQLEDELMFQNNYRKTLYLYQLSSTSVGNVGMFIDNVDTLIAYFQEKNKYPPNISRASTQLVHKRLNELPTFYSALLRSKQDITPLDESRFHTTPFSRVNQLYDVAAIPQDQNFRTLYYFITEFDKKSKAVAEITEKSQSLNREIDKKRSNPDNKYFHPFVNAASKLKQALPTEIGQNAGVYRTFTCGAELNKTIKQVTRNINIQFADYSTAKRIVPNLNYMKLQGDFRAMLDLLLQYPNLRFLYRMYDDIDRLSVDADINEINDQINKFRFAKAENKMRTLFREEQYLNPPAILPVKEDAIRQSEDLLMNKIDVISRTKVRKFLDENYMTVNNVESMYSDSVFKPAYDMTFASGSPAELNRRKATLENHLKKMSEYEFPAKAITMLYKEFVKNLNSQGVLMGRAIVTHGKHYKGDDKKIKFRIYQANPRSPKWISKAKTYRRVLVTPLTSKRNGKNKYLVRINLRLNSDAKFPVYDVNIKLPKEIAKNAGASQWYTKITLNGKILKNQGRFRIIAPTAQNGWECQITPMKVNKDGNNFLDIHFTANGFKVIPISVMVQKPMIKKN